MSDRLVEKPRRRQVVYQGKILECHVDEVTLPNGKIGYREYLRHSGAVAIAPLMENGEIILVRQFRYPAGSVILEIPAGKIEVGESPEVCARRELSEEVGYEPEQLSHLLSFWSSPGYTDEVIHLYLAKGLKLCQSHHDPDEFLEVVKMDRNSLLGYLNSGGIVDGKTALALSLLEGRNLW